jgi:LysM repeat protein
MIYVVAPGDTLSEIARTYGNSVAQLQESNGIQPDQPLIPGQVSATVPKPVVTGEGLGWTAASYDRKGLCRAGC